MKMKYKFSSEQYAEIKAAQKANRDKQIENRLKVLALRCEGKSLKEIASATGFGHAHISNLIRKYWEEELQAVSEKRCPENRRNMSIEEETAFLEQYRQLAEQGHILDIREIEKAYAEKLGHNIGSGQIYRVLQRHGWRKVMPRSKHLKKAGEELRKRGFRNEVFATLEKVVDRLCDTICALAADAIHSITARSWVLSCFY